MRRRHHSDVVTLRVARWARRIGLAAAVAGFVLFFNRFWVMRVPAGMDTMPLSHPPGALCIVDRRPPRLVPGAAVFVELPEGGVLLLTVDRVVAGGEPGAETFFARSDNPVSRWAQRGPLGPYPVSAVRGLVLAVIGGGGGGSR
jgi:hypothetical protein